MGEFVDFWIGLTLKCALLLFYRLQLYVSYLLEKSVQIDPCRREKIDPLVKISLPP